jgi:hypothetical protein
MKFLTVFLLLVLIYIEYVSNLNLKSNREAASLSEDLGKQNTKLDKQIKHQMEEIKALNETMKNLEKVKINKKN